MRGFIDSNGERLFFGPLKVPQGTLTARGRSFCGAGSAGRLIFNRERVRGLGVTSEPSATAISSLPLAPPPSSVQTTLAQSYGPVSASSGSIFGSLSDWASKEAIAGTGITNLLLYGGAGFLLVIALVKGRRRF